LEETKLFDEVRQAAVALLDRRLIVRRCAADDRRHVCISEGETVVTRDRRRLIGEPGAMERGVEPVTAAIAREDAARAVAAVRRRSEPDDPEARPWIAEARERLPPVRPFLEAAHLFTRHPLAVLDEAGTAAAADDPTVERRERRQALQRAPHMRKQPVSRIGAE